MKTDEQVLKEWMSDRIAFEIGRRRFFTQYEFAVIVNTFEGRRLSGMDKYNVKKGTLSQAMSVSNLVTRSDFGTTVGPSFPRLDTIKRALQSTEHQHLCDPRQLARFESVSELYNYLQNADNKLGIMRVGVPIQVVQPAEHIKIKVVISAAPKKRER